MTELNDLFEQIFHSERNFKEKIEQLKTLNAEIEDSQMKLEQIKEDLETKQGELVVKNSKLAGIEIEVKLLQLRRDILEDQKTSMKEAKDKLIQEFQITVDEVATERHLFEKKLKEFSCCYDLHGSGLKYREEEDKKKASVLQDELILLETEMVEIGSYREDVKKLQEKLSDVECELLQERETENELKATELEQGDLIKQLEEEKILSSKASNNSDLKRLQSELDACKNSCEEEMCKELNKELEDLQRKCYHKQMKLQIARQNRQASKGGYRSTLRQCTPEPDFSGEKDGLETTDKSGSVDLIDEEWLEIGTLEEFENDEDEVLEDEWDIDEASLEQITRESRKLEENSISARKIPPRNFAPLRNANKHVANTAVPNDFHSAGSVPSSLGNHSQRTTRTEPMLTPRPQLRKAIASSFIGKETALASPSNVQRKRPGKSIVKVPSVETSSSIKTAKKVRFHY